MELVTNELRNVLRAMPRFILLASLALYIITDDVIALRFALYFVLAEILSHLLKRVSGDLFVGSTSIYRPKGTTEGGCGVFYNPKGLKGELGMPSGHSLSTMFAVAFWSSYILKSSQKNKILRVGSLVLLGLSVMASRVIEGCHTVEQVLVGGALGTALGVTLYNFDKTNFTSSCP